MLLDRDALLAAQHAALQRFGVRLELRGERGRCVVAARAFEAGEQAFASRPAALALLPEQAGRRCDTCLARPPTSAPLARCSRCKRQRYCSQACQRAAWKEHHAVECGALAVLAAAAPSDAAGVDLLLACRTLRAAEQQAAETTRSSSSLLTPGFDDAVGTLWHADDASARALADDDAWVAPLFGAQQAARALLPSRFDAADVVALVRAGRRNNFALADDILTPLAAASFPFGALLNHGCDANCVIAYERDDPDATPQRAWLQRVRAVRRIAPGEELVHSYVDVAATTAQRRMALQQEYGIAACGCALCADAGGERDAMLGGCPSAAAEAAAALQARAAASNDADEEQQLLAQALDALRSAGAHPCSLAVLAARRACLHAALAAGDTERSSAHALAVAAASARVYAAAPHPRAALDALTAGSAAAAWAAAGGGGAAAADAKAALDAALALLHATAGAGGGAHGTAARQLRDSLTVGDDGGAAAAAPEALEAGDGAAAATAAHDPSLPPAAASDARLPARLLRFATGRWDLARVACAPSPDALLQLSADTLTLTPSCVAAVLSRLLRLLRPSAAGQLDGGEAVDWTADPRFRHLLAVAEKQLAVAKRPRSLFLVFFAVCALYGHGPGRSMRPTGRRFQLPPRTFVARAVAVAGKQGFLPALLPKELAFMLQACVQVRAPVAADWLRDMWPASGGSEWASLDLFSQHDLFSLFVALRRLKIEPPEHWQQAMWRSPAARAWDADAKTSALYLTGMPPVLLPPPAEWLEPYWEESCRAAEADELSQGAMVRVMSACGRMHVTPPEAWLHLFWRSCARDLSTGQMTFDQLPNVLFNASLMQLKPPEAFSAVLFEAAVAEGDGLSEDQFDALLLAVRRMGLQPPKGWEIKLLLRGAGANNAR